MSQFFQSRDTSISKNMHATSIHSAITQRTSYVLPIKTPKKQHRWIPSLNMAVSFSKKGLHRSCSPGVLLNFSAVFHFLSVRLLQMSKVIYFSKSSLPPSLLISFQISNFPLILPLCETDI